jgi:Domain of unknown function (DUF4145)
MVFLENHLQLERCPYCNTAKPLLAKCADARTQDYGGRNIRLWNFYACGSCGGVVTAGAPDMDQPVEHLYPTPRIVDESVPHPAKTYLQQAVETIHAPSGSIMLAASAVDAMLKVQGYKDGSLKSRIDAAAKQHLITADMAAWAHDIRLDANEQRHADETVSLPDTADAERCVEFALALAEFLFVLPERVRRGRQTAIAPQTSPTT